MVKVVPEAKPPCSSMRSMPAFHAFQPETSANSYQTRAGVARISTHSS
jgi:hypothetical protein